MLIDPWAWSEARDPFLVLLSALLIDAAIGDPARVYDRIPHPVALVGRVIGWAEARLNTPAATDAQRFARGLGLTIMVTLLAMVVARLVAGLLADVALGWLFEAMVASVFFVFRGLYDHARAVVAALGASLAAAREAVGEIVGRDPASLDRPGVCRAAVESVAENFSDGVVAPAFWFALLGLPGLVGYKAINTLDSMIGHRSARYAAFGKAAAVLDDWANWVPARLAGLLFVAAAALLPGASAARAWQTVRRDADKHRSVNAGWQEAAVAGALGFALAGPRQYGETTVDDAWMGDGRTDLTAEDLRATLRLYLAASVLLMVLVAVLWLV